MLGAIATVAIACVDGWLGIAIAFVVLHFFLFCNVLRMSRPLELIWAGVFVVVAALAMAMVVSWPLAFGVALVATVVLAIIETRRPSYHGIAWQTVNPNLPHWWQTRTQPSESGVSADEHR